MQGRRETNNEEYEKKEKRGEDEVKEQNEEKNTEQKMGK
jgi:hypothetical protein